MRQSVFFSDYALCTHNLWFLGICFESMCTPGCTFKWLNADYLYIIVFVCILQHLNSDTSQDAR